MPRALFFCFFFSSRRRHTRLSCDWSSDVCSSDLRPIEETIELVGLGDKRDARVATLRSEERRVGKSVDLGGRRIIKKKKKKKEKKEKVWSKRPGEYVQVEAHNWWAATRSNQIARATEVPTALCLLFFFFQAEDGIRDYRVTGVQTCALPIWEIEVVNFDQYIFYYPSSTSN